jgi:UDP-N-acetylglucosamine acyltransferase
MEQKMHNNNLGHKIHPTAIVNSKYIGRNVEIGAYSIVGENVALEEGVKIHSHVVLDGNTKIGEFSEIFPFASIGTIPQDLKYKGEPTQLIIGKRNKIREHVTINTGTEQGGGLTEVGNDCLLMVGVHIAHDCKVGNGVIMANNATLAGHVIVEDFAVIGGLSAIHQFVRIGKYAMIGGMSGIENDVIPYGLAMGKRANLVGLNLVGLKRKDFSKEDINLLRKLYKEIFGKDEKSFSAKIEGLIQEHHNNETILELLNFLKNNRERAICRPE